MAMFCTGTLFLGAYLYAGYKPRHLIDWTGTSFVAAMYIIPIVGLVTKRSKLRFAPVELLGRASYNIYLAQMLFLLHVRTDRVSKHTQPLGTVEHQRDYLPVLRCAVLSGGISYYRMGALLCKAVDPEKANHSGWLG